jgi:cation transport regulator ChaC
MRWFFAHGSVMFAPAFEAAIQAPGRVVGWERRYGHPSVRNWGTPRAPAPTCCLIPGEAVDGVVFGVPAERAQVVEHTLRSREALDPISLVVETASGAVEALTWPMGTEWAHLDPDELASHARRNVTAGGGPAGHAVDYVRGVAQLLADHVDRITLEYLAAL